jgi:hypothetical protein
MPTQPRNIAEAALQLQTAAAELHALSVLPEAGRDESIHEAIEDIGERVEQVEDSLKQLRNDFRSLRDKMDKRMKSVEAQYVVFGGFNTLTEYPLTESGAAESTTTGCFSKTGNSTLEAPSSKLCATTKRIRSSLASQTRQETSGLSMVRANSRLNYCVCANRVHQLSSTIDSDCIRIAKALGWTLIANDSLYVKQNFVLGLAGLSTSAVDSHW